MGAVFDVPEDKRELIDKYIENYNKPGANPGHEILLCETLPEI